jgi:hypothetical protein
MKDKSTGNYLEGGGDMPGIIWIYSLLKICGKWSSLLFYRKRTIFTKRLLLPKIENYGNNY